MLNRYNTGGDYVMGVAGIDVGDVVSNKVWWQCWRQLW